MNTRWHERRGKWVGIWLVTSRTWHQGHPDLIAGTGSIVGHDCSLDGQAVAELVSFDSLLYHACVVMFYRL